MSKEKSPAFQFFPRDFISDEKVMVMDMAQRGIYITLLCFCWTESSIPADAKEVLKLCRIGTEYESMLPPVLACFTPLETNTNRLVHQRLERIRAEQAERRQRRSEAGKKGGHPPGSKTKPKALPKQSESNAKALKSSSSSSAPADDPPTPLPKTGPAAVRPLAGTNGRPSDEAADSAAGPTKLYRPAWQDEHGNLKPEFQDCRGYTEEEIAEVERQVLGGDR